MTACWCWAEPTSPGGGRAPLGLGAGVNASPLDAATDGQSGLAAGLIGVRMAPTHHGLEGTDYVITALAVALKNRDGRLATSAVVGRLSENKLRFDPGGAAPVEFADGYLPFPEGAAYNFNASAQGALAGRTFRLDPSSSEASVVNIIFSDKLERRWVVVMDAAAGPAGFVMPVPLWGSLTALLTGRWASGRPWWCSR